MTDIARLGIQIDSSTVPVGKARLDELVTSAGRAEAAAAALGKQSTSAADGVALQAAAAAKATNETSAFSASSKAAATSQSAVKAATNEAAKALENHSKSALLTSNTLRELHFALDGLSRGNYSQVARDLGAIAASSGAFAAIATPLGIAVTGVGVALTAYAAAVIIAEHQTTAFQNALIFTGNASGATTSQLVAQANALSKNNASYGAAVNALTDLASTGQIAARNLQQFAAVAIGLNQTIGTPVAETAKQFAELGKSPVEASVKLNDQYHYLTASVYDQIAALQKQGDVEAAGEVAQKAFADAQQQRVAAATAQLGVFQRFWHELVLEIQAAGNAVVKFASPDTLQQQLQKFEKLRAELQNDAVANSIGVLFGNGQDLAAVNAKIASLQEAIRLQSVFAKQDADNAAATQKHIADQERQKALRAATQSVIVTETQAQLSAQQSAVQDALTKNLAVNSAYQTSLDALHSAGLLDDQKYYAARRDLIEKDTQARIDALQEQNAVIREEDQLQQNAAKAQLDQLQGPDNQAARIKIQADADAKTIASQQKIRDNETQMFALRQQSAAQIKVLTTEQDRARLALDQYNVRLTNEANLLGLTADQRRIEIEVLQREQELKKHGVSDEQLQKEAAALRERLTALQQENKLTAAQDQLLADSVEKRSAFITQLEAINKLSEKKNSGFTAGDSAAAVTSLIGPDVLRGTRVAAQAIVDAYNDMYAKIDAANKAGTLSDEDAAKARLNIAIMEREARFGIVQDMFAGLAQLQSSSSRRAFEIGKAAAIANATISAGEAIANAYATKPWYLGLAQAAVAGALLYSQIEQIKNTQFQGYMSGGYTGDGPVDQVAGVTHGREYVLNAAATARIGVAKLDALNAGTLETGDTSTRLASRGSTASSNSAPVLNFHVVNQNGSQVKVSQLTPNDVQIMITDAIQRQTPKLVASQLRDPNSMMSKAVGVNTTAQRRR